ncbi:MAG: DUF4173 domain-containing protein [Oscillospiraceae bacterium]|nr:DUF4173 domain-containing protein [Oscillospiraceae bacterium]
MRAAPVYPKRRAAGRDLILALLLLAACFLLWDSLRWANGLGLGEALGLTALLPIALWYLGDRPGKLRGYGAICAGLYLIGALSLIFSGDAVLKALLLLALPLLFVIVILERLALRTGNGLLNRLHDCCYTAFVMSFGRLNAGVWALTHCGAEETLRSKQTRAIGLGLLCAVPALFILLPLLISSDAAFEGLLGSLDWSAAGRGALALLYGGFGALLVFTLLFSSDRGPRPLENGIRRGLEPVGVAAFLGAVSAAYVLYLAAQFAYFTDAFRGLLPKDFTVAEYARRGFFEMCAIVAINLGLIVIALSLCRKEGGRVPKAVKSLSLFLCFFSLLLVATAISKMLLYMGSFGLTRLRVLTSAFMVWLAVVVAAVGLRLFVKRTPVLKLAVTLGAAMLIALSLANVDGIVARYNVDAWRSGRLDSLDVRTVCELGDGAVPALTELARDLDPKIREAAQTELRSRSPEQDWRSWNLIAQQAADALETR